MKSKRAAHLATVLTEGLLVVGLTGCALIQRTECPPARVSPDIIRELDEVGLDLNNAWRNLTAAESLQWEALDNPTMEASVRHRNTLGWLGILRESADRVAGTREALEPIPRGDPLKDLRAPDPTE